MRVTDQFRFRTVIRNLNSGRERTTNLQEQLATGKRINRPSDDPVSMSKAMKLRTVLENNEQYQTNIQDALTQLTAQEEALNSVQDALLRIKEIAIEGASDSITIRKSLAQEVEQIFDALLETANTKFNGKYIFGGTETLTQPFQKNVNVLNFGAEGNPADYYGNFDKIERQINERTRIEVTLNGYEVFEQTGPDSVNIFKLLNDLKIDLENEDSTAINGAIQNVDTALEQNLENFLKVGTRKQVIFFNDDRFNSQNTQIRAAMSNLEDTDFGEAFVTFKAEENALNSALSAGARVVSPSLIDFLGAV